MYLVLAAAVLGLGLGLYRRRRAGHRDGNDASESGSLHAVGVKGLGVLVGILVLHVGVRWVPPAWRNELIVGTQAMAVAWVAWAVRLRRANLSIALFVLGAALNLTAMLANGGIMPVSNHALAVAGHRADYDIATGHFYKHARADGDTRLTPLTDVLALPESRLVISVGDIVMALGLIGVFAALPRLRRAEVRIARRTVSYAIVS